MSRSCAADSNIRFTIPSTLVQLTSYILSYILHIHILHILHHLSYERRADGAERSEGSGAPFTLGLGMYSIILR